MVLLDPVPVHIWKRQEIHPVSFQGTYKPFSLAFMPRVNLESPINHYVHFLESGEKETGVLGILGEKPQTWGEYGSSIYGPMTTTGQEMHSLATFHVLYPLLCSKLLF